MPPVQAQQMTMRQSFWRPMHGQFNPMVQALQQPLGPYMYSEGSSERVGSRRAKLYTSSRGN